MAKRTVKQVDESAAASKAETSETAKSYTDGGTPASKLHRILVYQEGGPDAEYYTDTPRAREVTIGGQPFDHCNTATDGTWIYRNDRRN